MSHHGYEGIPPQIPNLHNFDELKKQLNAEEEKLRPYQPIKNLGATGQHPEGKLNENDEGEIKIAIGHLPGKVVLDFGDKPIKWIGFNPVQARQIAMTLLEYADECMIVKA